MKIAPFVMGAALLSPLFSGAALAQIASQQGASVAGQRAGGISYVTRRTPMWVPGQQAAGFFAASGVPLTRTPAISTGAVGNPGGGLPGGNVASRNFVAPHPEPSDVDINADSATRAEVSEPLPPEALTALRQLAAAGDPDARKVLLAYTRTSGR
jgi:hypothetical protein